MLKKYLVTCWIEEKFSAGKILKREEVQSYVANFWIKETEESEFRFDFETEKGQKQALDLIFSQLTKQIELRQLKNLSIHHIALLSWKEIKYED